MIRSCYLAEEPVLEAIQFAKRFSELNGGYSVIARDFDVGRVKSIDESLLTCYNTLKMLISGGRNL